MDTEVWWATVHRVTQSRTRLKHLAHTQIKNNMVSKSSLFFLNHNIKPEEKIYNNFFLSRMHSKLLYSLK